MTLEEVDRLFRLAQQHPGASAATTTPTARPIYVWIRYSRPAALARAFARNNEKGSKPRLLTTPESSADVTGRKRRVTPKNGVDDWRLNEAQRDIVGKRVQRRQQRGGCPHRTPAAAPLLAEAVLWMGASGKGLWGISPSLLLTKVNIRGVVGSALFKMSCVPLQGRGVTSVTTEAMDAINHRTQVRCPLAKGLVSKRKRDGRAGYRQVGTSSSGAERSCWKVWPIP